MKKFMPPHLFLACLIITAGLHYSFPIATLIEFPWNLAGAIPLAAGLVFLIWGSNRFTRVGTNIRPFNDPNVLVTSGPFRVSRNPMYLGFTLVLIGVWLFFGTLTPALGTLVFVATISVWFIPDEEIRCEAVFGEDYLIYKREVRRWL